MIPNQWPRLYCKLPRFITFVKHHLPKHRCLLCQHPSTQRLCEYCTSTFFYPIRLSCTRCALPLTQHALLCGECIKHRPAFDDTVSTYLYQPPLSDLLLHFKGQGDLIAGKVLAGLMVKHLRNYYQQQHLCLPSLIIPVPLHWRKQAHRGFNQSRMFAEIISTQLSIPLADIAKRTRASDEQKQLNRQKRFANLKNSFALHTKHPNLTKAHVAIVDDVMTTGATANALAHTLKRAGIAKVSVWTLARTPKQTV